MLYEMSIVRLCDSVFMSKIIIFNKKISWLLVVILMGGSSLYADTNLTSERISSYLAGRIKDLSNDYIGAAEHYRELIANDPKSNHLRREGMLIFAAVGDWPAAFSAARKLEQDGFNSFFVHNILLAADLMDENYEAVLSRVNKIQSEIGSNLPPIVKGWAYIGAQNIAAAKESFIGGNEADTTDLLRFHWGLALAMNGNFEAARELMTEIASRNERIGSIFDQLITAWAQSLIQLERDEEALLLIEQAMFEVFPQSARTKLSNIYQHIRRGNQVNFDIVSMPRHGVSKLYIGLARDISINGENGLQAAILFLRMAQLLHPENSAVEFELATLLERATNYEMALALFNQIEENDALYIDAQTAKLQSLDMLDRRDEAINLLVELVKKNPENLDLVMTLGFYRLEDKEYAKAESEFESAVQLVLTNAPQESDIDSERAYYNENWVPFFRRAIAKERQGDWLNAKTDLQLAANYSNGNPLVLNYLGYSMLIQGENVILAEKLIREALQKDPENAAIIDSLGWALFLQGKYEEALPKLEKAVRLMPNTAEVLDHLGDVYWKVGRTREAEFQWKRTLLFEDENVDRDRVQQKINIGLDKVLEGESSD